MSWEIKFLNELGNPFSKILTDPDGIISISLGAYGVPETFLLNNKSKVRSQKKSSNKKRTKS